MVPLNLSPDVNAGSQVTVNVPCSPLLNVVGPVVTGADASHSTIPTVMFDNENPSEFWIIIVAVVAVNVLSKHGVPLGKKHFSGKNLSGDRTPK